MTNPSTDTRTKKTHKDKTQFTKRERLNKTQEGLNETVRIQRDDSIGKLNKQTQLRDKSKKRCKTQPKEVETEETKLNKRWPKSQEVKLKQKCMKAETGITKLDKTRAETS